MTSDDIRFTRSHEWARRGEQITVGITDYAVEQLNKEIVFVELPQVGKQVKAGEAFGVIEAVKTAADLYAPVSGTVTEVNSELTDNPSLLAEDPYGKGWIAKIAPSALNEWDQLLSETDYKHVIQSEEHH